MKEEEIKQKIVDYITTARFLDEKAWELVPELDKLIGEEKTNEFLRQLGMYRAKPIPKPVQDIPSPPHYTNKSKEVRKDDGLQAT